MEKILLYTLIGATGFIALLFAIAYLIFLGKVFRDVFCAIFNIGPKREHLPAKAAIIIGIFSFPLGAAAMIVREKYTGMQTDGQIAGSLLLASFMIVLVCSLYLGCVEENKEPRAGRSYHGCCHPDDCDGNMGITDPND